MEETLELLQTTLPCINTTAEIVSRPPFSFIRLVIECLGLTPPSMPFNVEPQGFLVHNKVNFDKREKLVLLIKTLASVDELLKRPISFVVSVSEVIAGKSPLITMYMLRSLVEVFRKNTPEQIQSIVRLVDLKDPAVCFGQSLKKRETLVKAAAILKGGAVRLRLKQMGDLKSCHQPSFNSELLQTRTCPSSDTIKTPIVNVTKMTRSTTTRMRRHTQQNHMKGGPSQQHFVESLAQRELELRKREERVQRTAEALRREHSRMDKKQMEDRMTLLRQVQQERHSAEESKKDAERMLKQARRHRQAALRSDLSIADRSKVRDVKLERNEKKQTPHAKRLIPTRQASKSAASKQKTSVSLTTMDSHQPRNNDNEKISVKEPQERGSCRPNQLPASNQPACRAALPILKEPPLPILSTGQESSKKQIHHSKNPQSKPKLNKTCNVAVVVKNINKSRPTEVATSDVCASTIEEESKKEKVQTNKRCSSARVRFRTTEKDKFIEKGPVNGDVSQAKPRNNTSQQHVSVKQRPKTAIGSGGRKPTSKVVVQEVGDAMTWIANFDKKLSHALSDLEKADYDVQFTNMELSPTGQAQLCTN